MLSVQLTHPMKRWHKRVAMVTGAASTIGQAVSEMLAREGMNVVGVDDGPDFDKLDAIAAGVKSENTPGGIFPFKCDIKSPELVKKLFLSVKSDPDLEGVDVCVHCGNVAMGESILDGNPLKWKEMLETNVLAAAYISQETVRSLKERELEEGHIIFMNGMCSHRLVPGNKALHFYAATKYACRALLEGVRYELRLDASPIRVSAISSGVVETTMLQQLFDNDEDQYKKFFSEKKYLESKDVAAAVKYVLEQPPHVQVHDVLMRSTSQVP